MKYQQQQLITEKYDHKTNIWILNIQNNLNGLQEVLQKINKVIKQHKLGIEEDKYNTKKQKDIHKILNFLSHNYIANNNNYITATNLRNHFMQYNNTLITATKFGKLMTIIINLEISKLNIKKKKIKISIVYFSLQQIN